LGVILLLTYTIGYFNTILDRSVLMWLFVVSGLINIIVNITFVHLIRIIQLFLRCNLSQLIRPRIHRYKNMFITHCLEKYLNISLD